MNELQAVVETFGRARRRGERAALATVVGVEGSAYRRPGARMIVTESGATAGTISGGCLERDAALRAAEVMEARSARVVVYDTRGGEDIVWGLGLGCNGVVRVLLESLHEGSQGERALRFVAGCLKARRRGLLATVVTTVQSGPRGEREFGAGERPMFEVGERLFVGVPATDEGLANDAALEARVREDAREILAGGRALTRAYETDGGRAEIFFDVIAPPRPLVVFGAEQDAAPLVHLARTLGWHVTVVDTRARPATRERFAEADEVLLCRAEEVAARVGLTPETAVVVMTHNYLDDVELLRALLPSPACYVGVLGPKQRTAKLLEDLRADSFEVDASRLARLHAPVGVDIGAETPEEIALSIVSEIKAACANRSAGFLRDRDAPIHGTREPRVDASRVAPAAANNLAVGVSVEHHVATREGVSFAACRAS
ncbi:MAG TPA: XdhC family protein [Pyrinomonadaceae bacterium]|jgi:xanthine/CO dehydrogenase XdhC/CoxF family maturation factor|nr:XdhC family protein [Pyrinomonadaceae bacterium]